MYPGYEKKCSNAKGVRLSSVGLKLAAGLSIVCKTVKPKVYLYKPA